MILMAAAIVFPAQLCAQTTIGAGIKGSWMTLLLLLLILIFLLVAAFVLLIRVKALNSRISKWKAGESNRRFDKLLQNLDNVQIGKLLESKHIEKITDHAYTGPGGGKKFIALLIFFTALIRGNYVYAQSTETKVGILNEGGVIITITLIMIPILVGIGLMIVKLSGMAKKQKLEQDIEEAERFADYLATINDPEALEALKKRKAALEFELSNNELTGDKEAVDQKGLINNVNTKAAIAFVTQKKKALKRPGIDLQLSKLIIWYFVCAAFWLVFGTSIGEYVGIKFVAPDADHLSWLSFGRLRPVHTNAVFWGWASLGMLGLGYYIVPMVSNVPIASIRKGWYTLYFINAAVISGTICLMAGINNGGGEYREYIWPVMLLFAIGLFLTLINFIATIASRKTKEIYISNWYIVSAIMFALTITAVAYIPYWQNGLGETIIQGYYMHQGVGMWFMLFTLGIVYYMLPQQLNRPIYSYSLGILAFWTQILFYTLIGTHHFVFSSIPWWLQTVAIAGSMGMVIPVAAGTTNFIMTFNGAWHKVAGSYTLPFFLVGTVFYFTGSLQGTAEAFRSTNLIWHFTDFTVAHSHLTMYGIICFFVWAGMYAVLPRITGREAPQLTIGAHFWLALIGLLFYTVPLMIGSTLRGQLWMEGKPFIETVVHMAPYWLWRAIGGSLMWVSHLFFAYNLYMILRKAEQTDLKEAAIGKLNKPVTAE